MGSEPEWNVTEFPRLREWLLELEGRHELRAPRCVSCVERCVD